MHLRPIVSHWGVPDNALTLRESCITANGGQRSKFSWPSILSVRYASRIAEQYHPCIDSLPVWCSPLPPPLLPSAAPVVRYASWAQRAPRSVSPAQSWDSQSSTEFANSRRVLFAERLLSSESGGSSRHDSPLGTTRSGHPSASYQRTSMQDNGEPPQGR